MNLDDEIREAWEDFCRSTKPDMCETGSGFDAGYRACYERHVKSTKVVDLSVVAGSNIPMLFGSGDSWVPGYLKNIESGMRVPYPYVQLSYYEDMQPWAETNHSHCKFDTNRAAVCFGNECPLPEGVKCRVWSNNNALWHPPFSANRLSWCPGRIYQVIGLLPDWVYPWETD